MARKIITYTLISLSSLFLILSLAGIIAAWAYNTPLTERANAQLTDIDSQLAQIQTDLRSAKSEVERALRIIQSAEDALASFSQQPKPANQVLEEVSKTLSEGLVPNLATTRTQISEIRQTLKDLLITIEQLNAIPFVNLQIPGEDLLNEVISNADSLDTEIEKMQVLAEKTALFISDISFLLGGDFESTKQNLQNLLQVLEGYDTQLSGWREQVNEIIQSTPQWVDNASISLTFFFLWFGLSQFGLLLHGLSLRLGDNPLDIWRETFQKRDS
jgi:F0F1-type ATP synthase membrane subunit b/b'